MLRFSDSEIYDSFSSVRSRSREAGKPGILRICRVADRSAEVPSICGRNQPPAHEKRRPPGSLLNEFACQISELIRSLTSGCRLKQNCRYLADLAAE